MVGSVIERTARAMGREREEAAGGEAAFHAFHARTARPLWAYLARTCGDRDLADDLVQEAYYRLLRSGFRGNDDEHRKNYLYRIATNLVRDHFRRRRPETARLDEIPETAGEGPAADAAAMGSDLGHLLPRLPLRERQLLWLAHVEGASHAEIAERLRVRPKSVRVMLFRARRRLADLLRAQGLAPAGDTMATGNDTR